MCNGLDFDEGVTKKELASAIQRPGIEFDYLRRISFLEVENRISLDPI